MKFKVLFLALAIFIGIGSVSATDLPEVTDHEVVKLYVFWKDGCSWCELAIETLNEIEEEYLEYFEIVTINVSEGDNGVLYQYITSLLGEATGVPYFVVGDQENEGFNETTIIEMALEEYQNEDYVDVVGNYVDVTTGYDLEDLEYACDIKGITYWNASEKDTVSGYVVLGIFVVIVGSLGYLIFIPKNNK